MKITVMPTLFALFCADGDASHQPPDIGENRDVQLAHQEPRADAWADELDPCKRYKLVADEPWRSIKNICPNVSSFCSQGWTIPIPSRFTEKVGYMSDANYTCTESTMAGLGAETWIRFDGPGGNALPLKPTCTYRCGMHWT